MPDLAHRLVGNPHRIIEARAHQFQLVCATEVFFLEGGCHGPCIAKIAVKPLQLVHDKLVARLFLAALHPAKPNMRKVLDPFEIGHRDTARVGIQVGNDHAALVAQYFIGARSHGAVRRFDDQRGLDPVGVRHIDHPFKGRRNKDIAGGLEGSCAIRVMGGIGIARDTAVAGDPFVHRFNIKAFFIEKRTIAFDDADDDSAVFVAQKFGSVITNIAKALHNDALALKFAFKAGSFLVFFVTEELLQRILHTPPRRFNTALNTSGIQRFARHTGCGVDVGCVHATVLVSDPRHLTLAGSHVGGGHVLAGVDQVTFCQFISKAAGNLFQLMFFPFTRVDTKPPLGATERCFDKGALIGHQRRQRLDLVLIDAHRITNTTFYRFHMFGMNGPITSERMNSSPQAHAETHGIGRIADPDLFFQSGRKIHEGHSPVEHHINGFTKGWFFVAIGGLWHSVLLGLVFRR